MQNNKLDQNKLRNVAGAFVTGITVVCVKDHEGTTHGMTANSFLSVSLEPPLVLFSVQRDAHILNYLTISKEVGISILSEDQKEISNQFAGMNDDDISIQFESINKCEIVSGAMAWYTTTVSEIISAGDHLLILCAVNQLDRNEAKPLLYYSGYNKLGMKI